MLEVQQALTITLSPTTAGYKRSILFLSPLAGSTAGPFHHSTTHNKRVQEEYPLSFPSCWKYSRPLPSTYHPQQEGTRGVSSCFPHLLEVQQALTITLSPTTRGYKRSILFLSPLTTRGYRKSILFLSPLAGHTAGPYYHPITTTKGYKSILFLSPLAGSTVGPYHHPTTHNKRVQEEFPLPFPTCWKYIRPLPSPYHPQQEGTRGVSSSFPHLLEIQETLTITLSSTTRGFLSPTCWKYSRPLPSPYHPQQEGTRVSSFFPHLLVVQEALTITLPPATRGYKRSILFLSPLVGSTAALPINLSPTIR